MTDCCQAETAIENNSEWCIGCGCEVRNQCLWVQSYSNRQIRKYTFPLYSRIKRFKIYLFELNETRIFENFEEILNVFGKIEFHWGNVGSEDRIYFYNMTCVLRYITELLEIPITIRTLKDQSRVLSQLQEIDQLMGSLLFDLQTIQPSNSRHN